MEACSPNKIWEKIRRGGGKGVLEEAFTGSLKLSVKEVSKLEVLRRQQVEVF